MKAVAVLGTLMLFFLVSTVSLVAQVDTDSVELSVVVSDSSGGNSEPPKNPDPVTGQAIGERPGETVVTQLPSTGRSGQVVEKGSGAAEHLMILALLGATSGFAFSRQAKTRGIRATAVPQSNGQRVR